MEFSAAKCTLLGKQKEKYLSTFLIALLTAAVIFIPFMIMDNGYFLFYGDFNVQQVPFYQHAHEMIRSGNIGWDWGTDLGVNFIGSYSFYLLGSPFFWITLLFPNNFVPYLMGPLLILKFACSALAGYCYIRRFTRTPEAARLGSLLYAFSGFSVYNIFFNHFHEAIIVFPLLLLSVEEFLSENRRGFFAVMVAIAAITNYFFFFGMVVFVIIYFFVRTLSGCFKFKFTRFLWFIFEAVLGLLVSAAILLPTVSAVISNSRLSELLNGWDGIMYSNEQIYLNIFECFFFPPDIPARPVFFPDADVKWSSLGGWFPVFSVVGVFAFMQQKKGNWLRRMMGILMFMALVPILNSAFYMFNFSYYARWFYMPILLMALATVYCVENTEIQWKTPYKWVMGITLATVAVIGWFPSEIEDGKIIQWGLYTDNSDTYFYRFLATSAIAVISLVILGLLLKIIKKQRMQFIKTATALVCVISVIYATYFIATGKTHSFDVQNVMIDSLIEKDLDLPGDSDTYRIDVYEGVDNTGMYLGYSSINAFHSVVPTSVTDFWEYVGESRGVASRPSTNSYASRALLGVKYLVDLNDDDNFTDDMGDTLMDGFVFYSNDGDYTIYQNENCLPMGFTYDYYVTQSQCDSLDEYDRSNMMCKAILLSDEQVDKYRYFLDSVQKKATSEYGIMADIYYFDYDSEELKQDTAELSKNGVDYFERTNTGFNSSITTETDQLVFFSVPYDEGWSATVNGRPVEIEKVNVGFMAVHVGEGYNDITFTYETPYLSLGIKVSLSALVILVVYAIICGVMRKKNKFAYTEYPEGRVLLEDWKRDTAADKLEQANSYYEETFEYTDDGEDKPDADETVIRDEDLYRQSQNFNRGFWINLDDAEEIDNTKKTEDENGKEDNR